MHHGAYLGQSHEQIRATLRLLCYYKRFLASDRDRCRNPEDRFFGGLDGILTKPEARRRLEFLIDVAINRKAGIPSRRGRHDDPGYLVRLHRDRLSLLAIARRVRVYQFETKVVRERFGHKLASRED